MTTTLERQTKNPPAWLVFLLAVSCGVTVANLYYAQPLLAVLRQDFHVSPSAAGALVTVTQLGYAAGMLLLVPLGDRLENRRLVTVQLAFTTAALVVAGTASSFGVLLGAFLVIGVTAVVAQVLVPYAADLASDETRGRVVGRVMSGLLTGVLLSRVLGSWLAQATSWRVVYLASAGLMALLVVTLRLALPLRQPTTRVPYGQLLLSTLSLFRQHQALRRRALYQAAMFGAFSAFWTTIAFLLTGPLYGYSGLAIGLFALVGAAGAAIAPLAGRWADRGIARPMTAAALVLAAFAFGLAGVGRHHIVLLALAAVLLDMAVQTTMILGQHRIYQIDSGARARLNSTYLATFFVGGAVGSQVGSIAYHAGGWTLLTTFGAALPLLALLLWLVPEGNGRRAPEPAPTVNTSQLVSK
jgi:predicted MFS family arabinose efflux permease